MKAGKMLASSQGNPAACI